MSPRKTKEEWKRVDGRAWNELRPLKVESGVLPNADGSAYIEMGKNRIMVGVFGPREMHPKHLAKPHTGVLKCRYHMAPFSTDPRRSPAPSRRDNEITMVMRYALEPAIFLERYPRSSIDVYAEILQADGGTRCASIIASTVALVDAGIPMRDLVVSCSAGKYNGRIILDLGDYEDKNGEADVPVAYMPKLDRVTLLQMDGVLTSDEMERCISTAIDGCKQIYEVQREALKKKYGIERPEKVEAVEAEERPMEEEEREEDQ